MVTLAQRIEQLRSQQGLTRPALAAALGLPRNAIEKFETGRQTPTKEQQNKLATYFGVSLAMLTILVVQLSLLVLNSNFISAVFLKKWLLNSSNHSL